MSSTETPPVWQGNYGALSPIAPLILDRRRLPDLAALLAALPPKTDSRTYQETIEGSLPMLTWVERPVSRKEIRTQPSTDPTLRRCARVVAMVHELHKAGYQRIRIVPQESPSGMHWRCHITDAANVNVDGYTIIEFDPDQRGRVAHYSSGQGADFFGWRDAADKSARQLALLFLHRFPEIAERGAGRDWMYAGWLTDFLGLVENADSGGLIAFAADYPPNPAVVDPWLPPPPR